MPKIEPVKIVLFISSLLKTQDSYESLFSSALNEGIRDVYKEMGNRFDEKASNDKEVKARHSALQQ